MRRLIPVIRLGLWAFCTCALSTAPLLTAQVRPITDKVYSAAQAARGQQLYTAQCAECHGKSLEGGGGPPLSGDRFLSNWSAQPLKNLADKIQKTMPFNQPATLSRSQSTDLVAYILQAGKFPAGAAELNEAALAQVAFPGVARAAAPTTASALGPTLPPPEGNLAELMRAIAFPNSNIIFNVQLKDPGAPRKPVPVTDSFDYVEWGSSIFAGWMSIDQAAIALIEATPLFLTPGRQCQNGQPVPVDRADWKKYTADLMDVGKLALRASRARNFEAFTDISEKLNDACANCHRVYRDRGGREGGGAARCQPPAGR